MVNAIIKWCLKNPLLMVILIFAFCVAGYIAFTRIPVDAIPDIGEKQVIVFADWPGRSPQDVDDQVIYPLTTSLSGTPGVKAIRSMSGFGFGMVYIIFKDDIDYYWARSRVLERMNVAQDRLPKGVVPVLGPDATALGQIFWYTVEGEGFDLEELRSVQDWYVRYQLQSVEGVSEVASVGGFVKQYQIDLHPDKMRGQGVTITEIYEAVKKSNIDVGAKVLERGGSEFFIRGIGFIKSLDDLEKIVIRQVDGVPIYLSSVATVQVGPDFRRGVLDKAGVEAVGGVVLMRYGENPREVLRKVKDKISQLELGLPTKKLANGQESKIKIVPFYDRSVIVNETMDTLKNTIIEEALLASFVVLFFLLHLRTTFAVLPTLPLGLAGSFILMYMFGVDSNIMALAGLAIAIGDICDMGIIMSENIHRRLSIATEQEVKEKGYFEIVYEGATEVGGAIVIAVTNTLVSFIPVFFLTDQEGKLFKPLAYAKTFAIGSSVILAITVVPFLCYVLFKTVKWSNRKTVVLSLLGGVVATFVAHTAFVVGFDADQNGGWMISMAIGAVIAISILRMSREKIVPLEENRVSRYIAKIYVPSLRYVLNHKISFMMLPFFILFLGMSIWLGLKNTMYPLEWFVNMFAYEEASDELKTQMHQPKDVAFKRPLLEMGEIRYQKIRDQYGRESFRVLLRRQDVAEKNKDRERGLELLKETRVLPGLGNEFMPPLDEGSFLYMPSLLPQASLSQVVAVNSKQDLAIASVPEVESVVGKVGRAESALDPAPISMMETVINLKPEKDWRMLPVTRFYENWPEFLKKPLQIFWPLERRITKSEILEELQTRTAIPGVLPTWLQPIQTRLVMLQTGFRAMMGVKIYGSDLKEIERIGLQMEHILKGVPGATDVIADRIVGKPYIEIEIDRDRISRYGVNIQDVQDVIEMALGGINIMDSVEGRGRYPIRVRLARDFREDVEAIEMIHVPSSNGVQIPLSELAKINTVLGPQEIKGEKGLLVGYVTMNTRDRDEVSVVQEGEQRLKQAVADGSLVLPSGYYWEWSGQYENQVRATASMKILIPVTLVIMFVMLYIGFTRWWVSLLIFFCILVSASGGFIMLGLWGVNLSVAVWVGFLVLFGVTDDDEVILSTYLEQIFNSREFDSVLEIREAVIEAGLKRIRPCLMTMATTIIGLMPIFWATGRGADVMRPMAIPSVGGMIIGVITIFVTPCLFCAIEEWKWKRSKATL